jgi:ribonuclease P protein subunit RPR2
MKKREKGNELAVERIERLFGRAEEAAKKGDLEFANRCIEIAWAIKLKFRVRLRSEQKRLFCRKCLRFFVDGRTARYRTEKGNLTITCLNCGDVQRIPLR